jgi:pyruvate dehydrogenase E1 component alpha subunit
MELNNDEQTKQELIEFEEEIKDIYLDSKIRAPVHLCGGNEEALIKIFKNINKEDWVFSTHRSHFHALLKGIPKDWVKKEILEKRSMHINNKEHKFFTSAIVGGALPIALGTALALKRKNAENKVWVFVGDMAAEMGVFHECTKYAARHNLPITFVVEDNGISVNTPTQKVWGESNSTANIIRYKYNRIYPHHGAGKWITF